MKSILKKTTLFVVSIIYVLVVWACSSHSLTVTVRGSDRAPVVAYIAVITSGDTVTRLSCGGTGTVKAGNYSCAGSAINISSFSGSAEVTIKSTGYSFETKTLTSAGSETITLQKLAAFELNGDYATGFTAETGLDDMMKMAYPVNSELGQSFVIKFYIDDIKGTPKLFLQNTKKHPIHYDFVHDVLGKAISQKDFGNTTYSGLDRSAMAGSIIYYPEAATKSEFLGDDTKSPFVVTFFPSDDLTPDQALTAHRIIEERLLCAGIDTGVSRVVYLPAGSEQESALASAKALFKKHDSAWIMHNELYGNISMQILNPGIAYGTLKLMTPDELEKSVVSFHDILLLTRIPNSLPVVGGTITEELQTPLAHVNVAARNRGTPNMALIGASADERIAPFIGKLVRFEVKAGTFSIEETTLDEAQNFWDSIHGDELVPEFDVDRDGLPGFAELYFTDSISVGVKAANLAELKRILADKAPDGFAVPFHYYDQFLNYTLIDGALCDSAQANCLKEGRTADICEKARDLCLAITTQDITLGDYIAEAIEDSGFKTDSAIREAALNDIRFFFNNNPVDPDFAKLLDDRVYEVFGDKKVKLRSSTNSEDLPNFSGAGLYDSFSAAYNGDKEAALVIRKTWSSVWNWDAYEERGFWNISHLAVKMGVAASMAFSDEAANGVIITQNISDPTVDGMYVNVQLGETSVTNPTGGELPEIFTIIPKPDGGVQAVRLRYSSLSPDSPILSEAEVTDLYSAALKSRTYFAKLYKKNADTFALDMEFKFSGSPRTLFIKQARPYVAGGQ